MAEIEPTQEQILAGCRAWYPALFRHGLEPQPMDGQRTVEKIESVKGTVARILRAALTPPDAKAR